ncbi:DUF5675 family protein [Sandarakinorhabdus sp.]|uniref:DUF5675 family protein n=1 Tax=Sandarakinorhabdus sp. TaxID=1916663 RepID=UPI003566DE8E
MNLTLTRRASANGWTLGALAVDNVHQCWTCEDVVPPDGVKIPGRTAIPAGLYQVVITWSNRFQRDLPLLVDVPGFVGIRIHSGNKADDTEGCILPGQAHTAGGVTGSRLAFAPLFDTLQDAIGRGDVIGIDIIDAPFVEAP